MLGDKAMNKVEKIIIGIFIGISCPLLTFVVFWWTSAFLYARFAVIPLSLVILLAFTGLGLGLLFDILFLRQWVHGFYKANLWLMVILYLCLCIMGVAFFMGLPIGTLASGTIAGIYMGRRISHYSNEWINGALLLRKTALITAMVTTLAALPIGILALNDQDIVNMLGSLSAINQASLKGAGGFIIIAILCGILFLIQYWLSRKAGLLGLYMGRRFAPQKGGGPALDS